MRQDLIIDHVVYGCTESAFGRPPNQTPVPLIDRFQAFGVDHNFAGPSQDQRSIRCDAIEVLFGNLGEKIVDHNIEVLSHVALTFSGRVLLDTYPMNPDPRPARTRLSYKLLDAWQNLILALKISKEN